jgi:hypothetical protein
MTFKGYPREETTNDYPDANYRYTDTSPEAEHYNNLPEDDGTISANVEELQEAVIGRKIVGVVKAPPPDGNAWRHEPATVLLLDNGTKVSLVNTSDCCASTELEDIVLHLDKIDHAILGVGTTDGYTKWHIYCDWGDVAELTVNWGCGNPFYYGYGFDITVVPFE